MKEITEMLAGKDKNKTDGKIKLSDYAYSILQIESKLVCNMSCRFCPYPVIETKGSQLSRDEVYSIIDSVDPKDEKLEYLCFSQFSEPLLDERIFEFVKYAKNKGFKVFLATNGLLLDSEKIRRNLIEAAPDYIKLSLQVLDKDRFEYARGVVKPFDLYKKGVFEFLNSCLENNCQSNIAIDVACNFLARPELFIRRLLGIEHGDPTVPNRIVEKDLIDFLKGLNQHSPKFGYSQEEAERFLIKSGPYYHEQKPLILAKNVTIKVKQFHYGRRLVDFYPAFKTKPCTVRVVSVLGNGSVVPCCFAFDGKLSLGNIRNQPFKDIIKKSAGFIKDIKQGKNLPDICRRCQGAPTKRGAVVISFLRGAKNFLIETSKGGDMEQAKLISRLEEAMKYLIEHERKVQHRHFGFWEKQLREDTEKLFDENFKIKVENLLQFKGKQLFFPDYPRTQIKSFYSPKPFYYTLLNITNRIIGNHRAKIKEMLEGFAVVEQAGFLDLLKKYPISEIGRPLRLKHKGYVFTWLYLRQIYFLGLLKKHLKDKLEPEAVILDIGSSYGIFSSLVKQEMPKSHNLLVDMPGQLIIAHYYLSQLFPQAKIAGFKEVAEVEKIDKTFIKQFDFVLVPTSMYDKLTADSVDLLTNFTSFSEMSREWFDLYINSGVFKTAPFLYTINRYDAYPTYDNKVTVLDYPLNDYKRIHMQTCPLLKNHHEGFLFFLDKAVRYPSEFFEFIGSRLQ